MSKLSERFKKQAVGEPETQQVESCEAEENNIVEKLLEKVNSVPYWNEYSLEKQRELVMFFVQHSECEHKETVFEMSIAYVVGFGALQRLIDNENVRAIFVKEGNSVFIEIDGRMFDTEIKLSQNMFQYILNYVKYLHTEAVFGCYEFDFQTETQFSIRKIINLESSL